VKYGVISVAVTAIVIAIAVVFNLLVGMTDIKFDLTAEKRYSIGDVTKELLAGLDKDVSIIGLFDEVKIRSDEGYSDVLRLLDSYQENPRISLTFVDPDRNPGFINELDPENYLELSASDFVVACGNKQRKLIYSDMFDWEFNQMTFQQEKTGFKAEEAISGAIKYVSADFTPTVFFGEGHGEMNVDADFSGLKDILQTNNFEVEKLNLMTTAVAPEEAELLVFINPEIDMMPEELDRVKDYLSSGGNVVLLFDYNEHARELPNFNAIMAEYNVSINNDKVKEGDENSHFPDDPYFIISQVYSNEVATTRLPIILLRESRSVSILRNDKEYITTTSLVQTSREAVGEPVADSGRVTQGPLDLAVASENRGRYPSSKIAVFGNATFISDSAVMLYGQYYQYGMRLFLDVLGWMIGESDDIIIESKVNMPAMMSLSAGQAVTTLVGLVIVLPLAIMGTGLVVYLRRRHL